MGRPNENEPPVPAETPVEESRAGRVVVDARGRNVWQWAKAALDSTSILLKRLENKDLAIEPTQKVPVMRGADPRAGKTPPTGKHAAPGKPGGKAVDDRAAQNREQRPDPFRGKGRGDGGKGGGAQHRRLSGSPWGVKRTTGTGRDQASRMGNTWPS
jgi:hypothetical protein